MTFETKGRMIKHCTHSSSYQIQAIEINELLVFKGHFSSQEWLYAIMHCIFQCLLSMYIYNIYVCKYVVITAGLNVDLDSWFALAKLMVEIS